MKLEVLLSTFMAAGAIMAAKPDYATFICHRGESDDAPENTLPAYKTAVSRGFGVPFDSLRIILRNAHSVEVAIREPRLSRHVSSLRRLSVIFRRSFVIHSRAEQTVHINIGIIKLAFDVARLRFFLEVEEIKNIACHVE